MVARVWTAATAKKTMRVAPTGRAAMSPAMDVAWLLNRVPQQVVTRPADRPLK